MRSRPHRSKAGFTLIELTVSVVVLALILGSVGLVSLSNRKAFRQGAGSADMEVQVRRAVDRVVQELMRSGVGVLTPDPVEGTGTDDLTYQKATGAAGGATTWSTPFRLWWDYEEGEVDDGVDNNGNGLIDEGRVLYTRDVGGANERTTVLVHRVREYLEGETANNDDDNGNLLDDERGFCLERVDDAIVIRLTLEHLVGEGQLQMRTIETSVKLRN